MTIGERIKQKREELQLSQDELAKKVGYKSRSSIQKIEAARNLPITKVEKMAYALGCTPSYLMGWEDETGARTERGQLVDTYIENAASQFYPREKVQEAMALYQLYENLTPENRVAFHTLLKNLQSDS